MKRRKVEKIIREMEIKRTLNFLLEHHIIDYNQYNELLVKSLPYIK